MGRKIISAMRISVDGYIEDPEGRQDWVDSWGDEYDILDHVDTCVLGSVMYPGYEQYWTAALDSNRKLPYSDKLPTAKEVASHCRFAQADGGLLEKLTSRL